MESKIEALKEYVTQELKRSKVTINDVEVGKAYVFKVKPEHTADLLDLVKCNNVHEAAVLVNSLVNGNERDLKHQEEKFTEQAIADKIDPLKPVGVDIVVFPAFG